MDAVDCICSNIHCALETKRHISSEDIIVDGLRKMDDVQPFFTEKVCSLLCTISTKDHEAVQTQFVIRLLHGFHLIETFFVRYTHQFKRLTGCTEDRASTGQDTGKIPRTQHPVFAIDQSFISIIKTINLKVIYCV